MEVDVELHPKWNIQLRLVLVLGSWSKLVIDWSAIQPHVPKTLMSCLDWFDQLVVLLLVVQGGPQAWTSLKPAARIPHTALYNF